MHFCLSHVGRSACSQLAPSPLELPAAREAPFDPAATRASSVAVLKSAAVLVLLALFFFAAYKVGTGNVPGTCLGRSPRVLACSSARSGRRARPRRCWTRPRPTRSACRAHRRSWPPSSDEMGVHVRYKCEAGACQQVLGPLAVAIS